MEVNLQQIKQAHASLLHVLQQGRILLNGMPLTGVEIGQLVAGANMLYGQAEILEQNKQAKKKENPKKG